MRKIILLLFLINIQKNDYSSTVRKIKHFVFQSRIAK